MSDWSQNWICLTCVANANLAKIFAGDQAAGAMGYQIETMPRLRNIMEFESALKGIAEVEQGDFIVRGEIISKPDREDIEALPGQPGSERKK